MKMRGCSAVTPDRAKIAASASRGSVFQNSAFAGCALFGSSDPTWGLAASGKTGRMLDPPPAPAQASQSFTMSATSSGRAGIAMNGVAPVKRPRQSFKCGATAAASVE